MEAQALIGFRRWVVSSEETLRSLIGYWPTTWDEGTAVARCHEAACPLVSTQRMRVAGPYPHRSPSPGSTCGLWGEYQPPGDPTHFNVLSGAIVAFGAIEEHEHGFRAEKARMLALYDHMLEQFEHEGWKPGPNVYWDADQRRERAHRIADRHDVPFLTLAQVVDFARNFGEMIAPEPAL